MVSENKLIMVSMVSVVSMMSMVWVMDVGVATIRMVSYSWVSVVVGRVR